jgi:3-hydroxyisobutyrate dehydrogenase
VTSSDVRLVPVGWVGLGRMGWPMARNLVDAGYRLTVHDADPERQAGFASAHACDVADGPGAFSGVAVVVTMLPDDAAVREAMLDWRGGIASVLTAGAVVVDMSSSHPEGTRALGTRLAELDVGLVDAPVSGGVPRAETGTLTLMIGGEDDAVVRVRPVLEVLGERLFRTGPLGSGHAMKALNNLVAGTGYAVAVEALAIGQRFGLDSKTMIEVMNASTGRSFSTECVLADHVLTGAYGTGFSLGLLAKDVGIAATLAEAAAVDAPISELVSRRFAEALTGLGPDADHSEAHKQWWAARLEGGSKGGG